MFSRKLSVVPFSGGALVRVIYVADVQKHPEVSSILRELRALEKSAPKQLLATVRSGPMHALLRAMGVEPRSVSVQGNQLVASGVGRKVVVPLDENALADLRQRLLDRLAAAEKELEAKIQILEKSRNPLNKLILAGYRKRLESVKRAKSLLESVIPAQLGAHARKVQSVVQSIRSRRQQLLQRLEEARRRVIDELMRVSPSLSIPGLGSLALQSRFVRQTPRGPVIVIEYAGKLTLPEIENESATYTLARILPTQPPLGVESRSGTRLGYPQQPAYGSYYYMLLPVD